MQSSGSLSLYITVCEMGMPTPATQSTDTFKETKYKIKIDSALLYAENNPSCSIAQWLLYPLASGFVIYCPTHLSHPPFFLQTD